VTPLTGQFSISILRMWDAKAGLAGQNSEQLCVLGLHWYESETIGLVLQQGLHSLLVVLDSSNNLKEQLAIVDAPVASNLFPSSHFCADSLAGHGSRMFLLGSSGMYCARLMHWQERLRTLQVGCAAVRCGVALLVVVLLSGCVSCRPG
jgi:hypothetical protein